jgi:hypothetical protein
MFLPEKKATETLLVKDTCTVQNVFQQMCNLSIIVRIRMQNLEILLVLDLYRFVMLSILLELISRVKNH